MKKIVMFIMIITFLIPVLVNADVMEVKNTDIILNLDEDWYVFTRENIKDNEILEKYNVSYEYMLNFFNSNKGVYVDALRFVDNDFIELFVYKELVNDITNLAIISEEELEDYAEEISESRNCATLGTITLTSSYNNETLSYVNCSRNYGGKYFNEYITVVNNDLYILQFQKDTSFSDLENEIVSDSIENIHFNVKKRVKEKDKLIEAFKGDGDSIVWSALKGALIGGSVGAVCGFVFYSLKKKYMDKNKSNENNNDNNINS